MFFPGKPPACKGVVWDDQRINKIRYEVNKKIIQGKTYVKGTISHTGREHEPISLKTWHYAIPNTAIKSFTITGNID